MIGSKQDDSLITPHTEMFEQAHKDIHLDGSFFSF